MHVKLYGSSKIREALQNVTIDGLVRLSANSEHILFDPKESASTIIGAYSPIPCFFDVPGYVENIEGGEIEAFTQRTARNIITNHASNYPDANAFHVNGVSFSQLGVSYILSLYQIK